MYLLYQGLYTLQILHTASLVGQVKEKIIAMGVSVQLTYIMIQNGQTMKKIFTKLISIIIMAYEAVLTL